ncbi:ASCH domain-containing protein [Microbacterium indicum]|uniref:ASCH domain-containing protein n=1 Tax=Microbacterium indicum TaxID=358100 RepID=UPI000414BAAA|nr:ASCH domain-containing protein [Microbacterium indicum]
MSIADFWAAARDADPSLPVDLPAADRVWGFGATPEHADELLQLVLDGVKTGTAGYLWEYQAEGEDLPVAGGFDVILDGAGAPRAVIQTLAVEIVPFDEVSAEHAFAEGEGDRSLAYWRRVHRDFFEDHVDVGRPFADDAPLVLERFRLRYAA